MKNTSLKKIGAVALAAVMAVTFAPASSLTVFAADDGVNTEDMTIGANGGTVDKKGTYKITDNTAEASETATGKILVDVDATLNLSGHTAVIQVEKGATVTLVDKSRTEDGEGGTGKAKITLGSTHENGKDTAGSVIVNLPYGEVTTAALAANNEKASDCSFTLKAGTVTDEAARGLDENAVKVTYENGKVSAKTKKIFEYKTSTDENADPKDVVKDTTPIATAGSGDEAVYLIGNAAISAYLASAATNAVAYNGDVVATGMKSGSLIKMDKTSLPGTSLKATAEDGKSLVEVEETGTYTFGTKGAGNVADTIKGTAKYTLSSFAAGKGGLTALSDDGMPLKAAPVADAPEATNNTVNVLANKNIMGPVRALGVKSYERAITLTVAEGDAFENLELGYADATDYKESAGGVTKVSGAKGITYFTADPTAYTKTKNGIAVIDGSKYIIDKQGGITDNQGGTTSQLDAASNSAKKTINVVRGTSSTAKTADDENTVTINSGVTLTGPATDAVFTVAKTAIDGKTTKTSETGYVYGTNNLKVFAWGDINNLGTEAVKKSQNDTDHTINVINVPADNVLTFESFTDTTVKKADGIDYFYLMKTENSGDLKATFSFGQTDTITGAVDTALTGKEGKIVTLVSTAKPGDIFYASAGIKGTYKDIEDLIDVRGEISATKTAQSNGKFTWVLNGGSELAQMYRFRNELTGEHFYTSDAAEVANLQGAAGKAAGWVDETEAKNTYTVLPATSSKGVAVYRLFNSIANEHFFTTDKAEADAAVKANCGWTLEGNNGVAFKAAPADTDEATVTVYRMHRPSDDAHLFTPDEAEVTWLLGLGQGWEKEGEAGVAYYGFK